MERRTRNRLLSEAVADPSQLLRRRKFWKLDFWPYYLRRCDDVLFNDPEAGLILTEPAPQLAAKIAATNPGANDSDLLLLGHSYVGSAWRRNDEYNRAEEAFRRSFPYAADASPKAFAEHLRRLAYLRLYQRNPECFPIVSKAITINRLHGNLVNRHALGECLICRGRAFVMFDEHGKAYDDYTAALNHVSLKIDIKPYYCALHSLVGWAVLYGTDEQLDAASANLKAALGVLANWWGSPYPKLKLRWLMAVVDFRRGAFGYAEEVFQDVRRGIVKLKLGYELGIITMDLALLYHRLRRFEKLGPLLRETIDTFRRIDAEPAAYKALDVWRQAGHVNEELLLTVREMFYTEAKPIPAIAA